MKYLESDTIFAKEFRRTFRSKRITLLGAGPMSPLIVEEIISLANHYKKYVNLIPSRRQVEAESLGGGYVNRWTTELFVDFVRSRDHGNYVRLSRDHSGPWQLKEYDQNGLPLTHRQAMAEVKESLATDLVCGFDLIHIDPSKGLQFGRTQEEVEHDIYELLDFCKRRELKQCDYEIGADDQASTPELVHEAESKLIRILDTIVGLKLQKPLFYVLQTGTKVMEMRNIGSFDSKLPVQGMLPSSVQLPEMLRMCDRYGINLKEHNADYLSDVAIHWHPRFGIHAANVAPEYGVTETRALLNLAKLNNFDSFVNSFSEKALVGGKWKKWLVENSVATEAEKVEISGHYHFADEEIKELRKKLSMDLQKKSIDLEQYIRSTVRYSINRYLEGFGYGI